MTNTDTSIELLSVQTGIEIFAIKLLQEETNAKPEHLKTHFSVLILPDDPNKNFHTPSSGKVVLLPGICFSIEPNSPAMSIIHKLRPMVEPKGYKLFLCAGNDYNDKNKIAIVRCEDEFTPLVYMQTNGANYGVNTLKLISFLHSLDEELDLKLIGADFDWCEFEMRKEPKSWSQLAEKVYEICPDVVEQGTGDIPGLETEMQQSKKLHLWFD